jgi:hypothetical protein
MKLRRIIFGGCFVMTLRFCWFGCLIMGDYGEPGDPPVPIVWRAFLWLCGLALWPLMVGALLYHKDPSGILLISLWGLSGLFWGLFMESIFTIWRRWRLRMADHVLVSTVPAAGVDGARVLWVVKRQRGRLKIQKQENKYI